MIYPNEIKIGNRYHRKHGKGWTEIEMTGELIGRIFNNMDRAYALDDFEPIILNEDNIKELGYQYYNEQTSGDMVMDIGGKIDLDWVDGRIQTKSHYEPSIFYRETHIKFVHQLQNAISAFNDIIK